MQNEITTTTDLLNADGNIAQPGFAKKMLYNYNRENVKAKNRVLKSGTIIISPTKNLLFALQSAIWATSAR